MTSLKLQKGTYIYAEKDDDDDDGTVTASHGTQRQRQATVYDAVAGRVSLKFAKDSAVSGSRKNSTGYHQLADPVLAPEEALFSRRNAPQRYAEKDVYFAHQSLPQDGRNLLPDSDMLKAVHQYTSHFYHELAQQSRSRSRRADVRCVDERSMDETALLAFGILLEEAAKESLGENGDLVFTEGMEEVDHSKKPREQTEAQTEAGAAMTALQQPSASPIGFQDKEYFWRRKYAKRRKIDDDDDDDQRD